jgi:S-adenosylmethionine:tRNA ribosyltransferase-isomerase
LADATGDGRAAILDGYDFVLPPHRIAQEPREPRDAARLLVLDRASGACYHGHVRDLPEWLGPGDCLVVNDTRVLPARLLGRIAGSERSVEALLLQPAPGAPEPDAGSPPSSPAGAIAGVEWDVLLRPARHCRPGAILVLADGATRATVTAAGMAGRARIRLEWARPMEDLLTAHGLPPLPPYIRRYRKPGGEDWARYQTVYAERPGAVAAPTAGLHFTPELLDHLAALGVEIHRLTLHVGPGTFRPVRVTHVADHRMEAERYEVPVTAARALTRARREGRRVVAVGTTTVRALETAAGAGAPDDIRVPEGGGGASRCTLRRTAIGYGDTVMAGAGWTDRTILPGHRFRAVDALLTNFHLPRSSLLLLVAAFAGRERVLDAYRQAVAAGYRFYSYGDAMLIL